MARRLQIEWQEDEATLKQLYMKEKDAQSRTKLQALWHLRQGRTIAEVAEIVGKHPRTIQDWIAWYRQGGVAEVLRRRHGGHGGRQLYLTTEQMTELKQAAREGKFRRVQDGIEWVKERYKVAYTYSGMHGVFRRLELRKKVPRPRNPQASAEEQMAWKKGG
uniref:Transposase n=1 Tax=uncultured Chloroflexota bacterium TaxID=166587 RepID=H5SCW1_9CHLR|nr:transposase [uncultured Chloroflexota bacterium]BAL53997.1 transposase [uncultured Chloroflexota bacterium]